MANGIDGICLEEIPLPASASGGLVKGTTSVLLRIDGETPQNVLWNYLNRQEQWRVTLPFKYGSATNVLLSDNRLLALRWSSEGEATIYLLDRPSGSLIRRFEGHRARVNRIALLPDDRRFVSVGGEGAGIVWDINAAQSDPKMMRASFFHADSDPATGTLRGRSIDTLAISPDGKLALTGDIEGYAHLWEIPSHESEETTLVHDFPRVMSAIEPTGVATYVEHAKTGIITEFKNEERRGSGISGAIFSRDSRRVFIADKEARIRVFDVDSGKELARHQQPEWGTSIRDLDISPDGRWLLMSSHPYPQLWEIGTERTYLLKGHQRPDPNHRGVRLNEPGLVHSIAFDPDGTAVTLGEDGMVRRWAVPTAP